MGNTISSKSRSVIQTRSVTHNGSLIQTQSSVEIKNGNIQINTNDIKKTTINGNYYIPCSEFQSLLKKFDDPQLQSFYQKYCSS